MAQEIGESREKWAADVWHMAEDFANQLKNEREPFYVVYAAKPDRHKPNNFRQSFRFYRQRPPKIIGLLVWKVDHPKGLFEFIPELSIPPDVPIDPSLLSQRSEDTSERVAEAGKKMQILLA